ncbi:protein of unknown function [Candidatus Methylocalor cossyra]|uniref:Uncharacterized protein n=1 Tax=Candidatus Methylocalor cossyra TaxID=3108543 RepID=A0ABM9NEM5_9GAMM
MQLSCDSVQFAPRIPCGVRSALGYFLSLIQNPGSPGAGDVRKSAPSGKPNSLLAVPT